MIERLEKEYSEFKANQTGLVTDADYVAEMERLSIASMVFADKTEKNNFYSELRQKQQSLYSEIFRDWVQNDLIELRSELSAMKRRHFLLIGASEFLSQSAV